MRFGREWAVEKSLIQLRFFERGDRQSLEQSVGRDLQAEAPFNYGDERVIGKEVESPPGSRIPAVHPPHTSKTLTDRIEIELHLTSLRAKRHEGSHTFLCITYASRVMPNQVVSMKSSKRWAISGPWLSWMK